MKKFHIMILKNEIVEVGLTAKSHGVKGELSFHFTKENFDIEQLPYFIFEMDGIFVPFYIETFRFKNNTSALIKLEGITNDEDTRILSNHKVYIPQEYALEESTENQGVSYYVGFTITDNLLGNIGEIVQVDESTTNVLFIIDRDGEELLIPATDDLISNINDEKKIIYMNLPEGLVNADLAIEE